MNPFTRYPMRRRLIPIIAALFVTAESFLPSQFELISGHTADIQSLASMIFVFIFILALFGTMRARMTVPNRKLTVFGVALVDFFTGLMVLAFTMVMVWCTLFILVVYLEPTPHWLTLLNRALVAGSGTLIIGTGAAVFYEMHLTGPNVTVHEDDLEHSRSSSMEVLSS